MSKHANVKITVDMKGAERAIRKFKRLCDAAGVIREYRNRKEYKKPSVRRKEKLENAAKRKAKLAKGSRGRGSQKRI